MLSRVTLLVIALALGVPASSGAGFFGPPIGPYKTTRLVLQAVAVEIQPGHESALVSLSDFRATMASGVESGWVEQLDSFHGRVKFFDGKRLKLPHGGSIEIRPHDHDLPGRLRLVVAKMHDGHTDSEELLTIRLDHRVGFEEGYAVVPLAGERRFLVLAVELRR